MQELLQKQKSQHSLDLLKILEKVSPNEVLEHTVEPEECFSLITQALDHLQAQITSQEDRIEGILMNHADELHQI